MIYCPKCGTANREGSKFCNECGTPLPATGLRCPMCGAMNPTGNLYCDRCGARLIPAERVSPEEEKPERPSPPKGISLPSVPLGEEGWLSELRAEAETLDLLPEEEIPERPEELEALPAAAIPDWLQGLEAPAA
ncbi:MAG: zinc ribbon domain-containing protein, partial [Anaerolineae bacterium]